MSGNLVETKEIQLKKIDIISNEELRRITHDFQGEALEFRPVLIHQLFAETAAKYPNALAARFEDSTLTYEKLNSRANQLAHLLISLGIKQGKSVGILMDKSLEMLVALLGVLKSGGMYVPLDPAFPHARLKLILDDCQPPILITERAHDKVLSGYEGKQLILSEEIRSLDCLSSAEPDIKQSLSDPIYVIYTSGTTGRPKGIVQTHGALSNLIQWQILCTNIKFDGAVLQFSSLCFDVHLQEIFSTLASGGCVCLISEEDKLDPLKLIASIKRMEVETIFISVSTLQNIFLRGMGLDTLPASLQHIITAGEQLYINDELRAYLQQHKGVYLHNHYGVSESHVVTALTLSGRSETVPLRPSVGRPIANVKIRILNTEMKIVPVEVKGEIWISGPCLADGYLNRPDLDAQYYFEVDGERSYKTRDLGRWLPDGTIEFLGRIDEQIKIAGRLVETGDVEASLLSLSSVEKCAVVPLKEDQNIRLAAYFTSSTHPTVSELRRQLEELLPSYMIPATFTQLEQLPVGPTGKVDRTALPLPTRGRPLLENDFTAPATEIEKQLADILRIAFSISTIGLDDNFFDLGADSLKLVKASAQIVDQMNTMVSALTLLKHPTLRALAAQLSGGEASDTQVTVDTASSNKYTKALKHVREPLAVVGMAGRFPGAETVTELWRNLLAGKESLIDISPEDLEQSFLVPHLPHRDGFVRVAGILPDIDKFDPQFFGIPPSEALWMDPQHRLFLECAWHALEDAGFIKERADLRVGVFAGCDINNYIYHVQPYISTMAEYLRALTANDKDFLATRVSYKLDLHGPSLTVQTACSTSLVAVHLACQAIWNGECEMALAGAVSVGVPQKTGYHYEEGCVYSPDGRIRPFDKNCKGINITNGVALVVLKSLEKALEDNDHIYALVRGSALNNDGARKVGYMAPSVAGQVDVITDCLLRADTSPETIDFVEAHGTGTELGDAVEVQALTDAYRKFTNKRGYCVLGSIKGNIGHLNRCAGITGFIKAVLSLSHGVYPGTINLADANPQLNISASPFYLASHEVELRRSDRPARGAVSSFGIGGTNAHVILEEYKLEESERSEDWQVLIPLSAQNKSQLTALAGSLSKFIEEEPSVRVSNVAYTRSLGRTQFSCRSFVTASSREEVVEKLRRVAADEPVFAKSRSEASQPVFMFPGHGEVQPEILKRMYESFPVFRQHIDHCAQHLEPLLGRGFRHVFLSDPPAVEMEQVSQAFSFVQPLLFAVQYSMVQMWLELGIKPKAMIGYSLGEYVAACLAGVFNIEDGLRLVYLRGCCVDQYAPEGGMINIMLPAREVEEFVGGELVIGIYASRGHTVVSGPPHEIRQLKQTLTEREISFRELTNNRANHSPMMIPVRDRLYDILKDIEFNAPQIPYISNVTGTWADAAQVKEPTYWGRHLCEAVRFSQGLDTLKASGFKVFVEIGQWEVLSKLARFNFLAEENISVIPSVSAASITDGTYDEFLVGVGAYWSQGGTVDWEKLYQNRAGRKITLPPYPFTKKSYWLPMQQNRAQAVSIKPETVKLEQRDWLNVRDWQRIAPPISFEKGDLSNQNRAFLILFDGGDIGNSLIEALKTEGQRVFAVRFDVATAKNPAGFFLSSDDQGKLSDFAADHVIYLTERGICEGKSQTVSQILQAQYTLLLRFSELHRLQIFSKEKSVRFWLCSFGRIAVQEDEHINLAQTALGAYALTAVQEDPLLDCRVIDFPPGPSGADYVLPRILAEIAHEENEKQVAYRGNQRFAPVYQRLPLSAEGPPDLPFNVGCVLIIGGLGKVGSALAGTLLSEHKASVVLTGRTRIPSGAERRILLQRPDINPALLRKIERLEELERAGGEVLYLDGDVTSFDDMSRIVSQAKSRFGRIHGLIHAAAHIEEKSFLKTICELTEEELDLHFRPKVMGLVVLNDVLRDEATDFRACFSSLSTILGGVGYTAYAACNLLADALVHNLRLGGSRWQTIRWDVWAGQERIDAAGVISLGSSAKCFSMEPSEGVEILSRLITMNLSGIFVSCRDLQTRLEEARHIGGVQPPDIRADVGKDEESVKSKGHFENPVDVTVALAWSKVLGIEAVSPDASFLNLGGDSLSAVQVVLNLNRALGVIIPMGDMLRSRTLWEFSTKVRNIVADKNGHNSPQLQRLTPLEVYPTTPWEKRWFEMSKREFGYLEMPVLIRGDLKLPQFKDALTRVIARHETLRSIFEYRSEGLIRKVKSEYHPDFLVEDLRSLTGLEQEKRLRVFVREQHSLRFNLEREVPLRVCLFILRDDFAIFYLSTHHIIFDGWSSSLLMDDLDRFYLEAQLDNARELVVNSNDDALQYGDFARWYQKHILESEFKKNIDFWQQHLKDFPTPLRLPSDLGSNADPHNLRGEKVHFVLSEGLSDKIRSFASANNQTVFNIFMAAYLLMLASVSGERRLVVGTTSFGRPVSGTEFIMGVFVNPMPLMFRIDEERLLTDFLAQIDTTMEAFHDHQLYPLISLWQDYECLKSYDLNDLFHVYILMQNYAKPQTTSNLIYDVVEAEDTSRDRWGRIFNPEEVRLMRDVEFIIYETETTYSLNLWYRTHLYSRQSVESWSQMIVNALDKMCVKNRANLSLRDFLKDGRAVGCELPCELG